MINNTAASYEVLNERGMTSISSKNGVQYTLDEFSRFSIIEDILGESFFKIKYDDFLTMFKNAGIPDPNFNPGFYDSLQLSDPKLKQLVLKVELSRFMINNLQTNDTFLTGLENFVPILANFIRSFPAKGKLVDSLVNKEVVRLNLLISEGFYNECLEVDIDKINARYNTMFAEEITYDKVFERNLQIFMFVVNYTAGNNPSLPVATTTYTFRNSVPFNAVLPVVNSTTQMTIEEAQSAAINYNSNYPPVVALAIPIATVTSLPIIAAAPPTIITPIVVSTVNTNPIGIASYAQAANQNNKSPLYLVNGKPCFDYDKVDMLLLIKFNQKNNFDMPLDAIQSAEAFRTFHENNEPERLRFYNCYITSKMNITKLHLSAGKSGDVFTVSHIHYMKEWPYTKERYIMFTNLPKEFKNEDDKKRKSRLANWCNLLGIAVDVNAFLGDRWFGINSDDVGQDNILMLLLPINIDGHTKSRQCVNFCHTERICNKFDSVIGLNIIEETCSFQNPLLFIDGATNLEVQFLRAKIQKILEHILDQPIIVILHPFYVKVTNEEAVCHHSHMIYVIYCVHNVLFDDLYNILNLVNKIKVQNLIVDGRILIMAKTIEDLTRNNFTKALISSVPNSYVVFNVNPIVTPEQAMICSVGSNPSDIFVVPSSIKPGSVDIHYIVPANIPPGKKILVDPGILPVGPVPITHAEINYARPNMASNGKNRTHNRKHNHFIEVIAVTTNRGKPTPNIKKK